MCTVEETEDADEAEKTDKYVKGLTSSLGYLMGLREDQDGQLHVMLGFGEDDNRGCVSIENVNKENAQQWEAGALTKTVADMKILPPEKIQVISMKVREVVESEASRKKPAVPPPPVTTSKSDENPFAMSKGPLGFYPPRKIAATTVSSCEDNASTSEAGQRRQFNFSKSRPLETPSAPSDDLSGNPYKASLFSEYAQPASKKPARGYGNRPETIGDEQGSVGRGRSGGHLWNKVAPNTNDNVGNQLDSQSEAARETGMGPFKTAYEQLLNNFEYFYEKKIDDKRKGIQRTYPPTSGVRPAGLRKPPREPERTVKAPSSDTGEPPVNSEIEELMSHECMKNVDAKMVEAILNEVIQVSTTDWSDIAGLEGVKKIIREIIIWPMERPDIFTGLRAAPRGILFFGPPGTGKTMFGRVIATQSKSTFFNISASSLTSKWIGDGEKMVRALFAVARVKQPSVIFIDEIDSILTQRSDTEHESSRRLKTEFLIQFDGCATSTEDRILVIGVTNRPQELDEAARRRLVKRIYIPLPDFVARKQLVKNLIKEYSADLTESDFDKIAKMTKGYSGADMASLCREAAYGPIREVGHLIQSLELSKVRAMRMKDFVHAQRQVKSSVAETDVILYEDWDAKFGCHIGGFTPDDSSTQGS